MKDKLRKVETRGKTCKLMIKERQLMMELFSPIITNHSKDGSFPSKLCFKLSSFIYLMIFTADREFKKILYREIDTLTGEAGDAMRKTEEDLFKTFVRLEVEQEMGQWSGSGLQNKAADMKIAVIVKSTFRSYEKTRKPYENSYFKFHSYAKK